MVKFLSNMYWRPQRNMHFTEICTKVAQCAIVSLVNVIGIFLDDGQVCTYYNFPLHGRSFESGDILELPRHGTTCTVVILGIHENLALAAAEANEYFKRLCKWDNVELSSVKLFGHELASIEEEVSQIAYFQSQGIDGPLLLSTNCFDLMDLDETQAQD